MIFIFIYCHKRHVQMHQIPILTCRSPIKKKIFQILFCSLLLYLHLYCFKHLQHPSTCHWGEISILTPSLLSPPHPSSPSDPFRPIWSLASQKDSCQLTAFPAATLPSARGHRGPSLRPHFPPEPGRLPQPRGHAAPAHSTRGLYLVFSLRVS